MEQSDDHPFNQVINISLTNSGTPWVYVPPSGMQKAPNIPREGLSKMSYLHLPKL